MNDVLADTAAYQRETLDRLASIESLLANFAEDNHDRTRALLPEASRIEIEQALPVPEVRHCARETS